MSFDVTISDSTPGQEAATTINVGMIQYYAGSPGKSYLDPGTGCPESVAMMAGGAVTHVAADKQCKQVQGIRIIIGDTAESVHSGFEMVNMNFHCNGTQPSVAASVNLSGPILA